MNKPKIPHNALVFVGDGRKALFLRNEGDETFPNLRTEKVFEDENPSSHEHAPTGRGALPSPRQQAGEAQSSPLIGTKSKSIDSREESLLRWSKWSAPARRRPLSW